MGHEKKTLAEMVGELLREAALLVGVFIPLDMMFSEKPIPHSVLGFGGLVFLLCLA
jgi:hypothetical protein